MEESATKTSTKQRIIIGLIAVLMLGSTIAVYVLIVLAGGGSSSTTATDTSELAEQYTAKQAEVDAAAAEYTSKYYDTFLGYKSEVKSYNATSANEGGLQTTDLAVGSGSEITEGDTNYFAYYIGWCADESIFDSSFDDSDSPTTLKAPLDPAAGLIEGWNEGVVGMKLGGVRELTIPGELAYGETQEICGGTNSPLKFVIMAVEKTEPLATLSSELSDLYTQLLYAYYGMSTN